MALRIFIRMEQLIKGTVACIEQALKDGSVEPDRVFASSSFQTQSLPLLHILSTRFPDVRILFIDTGYLFAESLIFKEQITRELGLSVITLRSEQSYAQQIGPDGLPLYCSDTRHCCHLNKVLPLQNFLAGGDRWISGVRRDQTGTRAHMKPVITDLRGVVRIHPMLDWTARDVYQYIRDCKLPRHPLENAGYLSIGCAPCTHKWSGSDSRNARWFGSQKTECGLHTHNVKA